MKRRWFIAAVLWNAAGTILTVKIARDYVALMDKVSGLERLANIGYCESIILCDSAADAFDAWLNLRRDKLPIERAGRPVHQ